MNRKGHIGTALLPIIALILVGNALFVMNSFNGDFTKLRAEIRVFSEKAIAEHELVEKNVNSSIWASIAIAASGGKKDVEFEKEFRKSLTHVINQFRTSGLENNIYAKLANEDYSLDRNNEGNYVLVVSDVFEKSSVNVNEVVYSYSMEIVFDDSKLISIKII